MLMAGHVDPLPPKNHAFGFEAHALFESGVAAELDLSAGAQDAVPRYAECRAQCGGDLAGGSAQASGSRDRSVGSNLPIRDLADSGENSTLCCCEFSEGTDSSCLLNLALHSQDNC